MSAETLAWLAGTVLRGHCPYRWPESAEVHVRTGQDGAARVWLVTFGGREPWEAPDSLRRTVDGAPMYAGAFLPRVPAGLPVLTVRNAAVRLAWDLAAAALDAGQPCRIFEDGVLVADWTDADIADLATGRED